MSTSSVLAVSLALASACLAQVPDPTTAPPPVPAPFVAGAVYDPGIPTFEAVTGHVLGAEIPTHAEIEDYLRALVGASDRIRLVQYGTSWQGRRLWYAVVATRERIEGLADVRDGMQRLADPRGLTDGDAVRLIAGQPAVAWLASCVHGDEASGGDAVLRLLYHLLAAQGDPVVEKVLAECVVIVDPLQNPDGRDRFVHSTRSARGRWADATPGGAEHSQPWPGGRTNHALFDMNRDWFALTQPETRGRVRAFLDWWPVVYADLHEMGGNSTYFFAPPAEPVHSEVTSLQREWLERYGQNNARWFDREGFEYFTRESFDSFYPGYGEGWPTFQGSIGMTFEMASSRGLVYRRADDSLLRYRDCVRRHFVAALATLETLANARTAALEAFLAFRRDGVARGARGPVREYVFPARGDRTRLARLCNLLLDQGIEVHRAVGELRGAARPLGGGEVAEQTFPPESFVVSMSQPASALAHVLIEPHFGMGEEFLAEQRRREARRMRTQFYDFSAWSLPLLFGVEAWVTTAPVAGDRAPLAAGEASSGASALRTQPPAVAYITPWGQNGAAALLADLLRHGVKARCIDRAFTLEGAGFPAGSFVVRVDGQPDGLHATMRELAAKHGVTPHCADSSWVADGPSLGSNRSHLLRVPRVAVAWDRPVRSYSAGWLRYVLEQRFGVPVSPVRTSDLRRVDLDRFSVLVLPEGRGYGDELGKSGTEAIVGFVRRGGVLVTLGSATRWLTEADVGLLATAPEDRAKANDAAEPVAGEGKDEAKREERTEPFDYDKAILPDKESPPSTPGAIVRVTLDPDHWLAFGYPGVVDVLHDSSNVLTPVKLDRGTNVAIYAPAEELVRAGFVWEETRKQLPMKAYLVHQPHGRGHVVAFAEDPNVRGFADGLGLLVMNAILLTAGR